MMIFKFQQRLDSHSDPWWFEFRVLSPYRGNARMANNKYRCIAEKRSSCKIQPLVMRTTLYVTTKPLGPIKQIINDASSKHVTFFGYMHCNYASCWMTTFNWNPDVGSLVHALTSVLSVFLNELHEWNVPTLSKPVMSAHTGPHLRLNLNLQYHDALWFIRFPFRPGFDLSVLLQQFKLF